MVIEGIECCALVHAFIHHPQLIVSWGQFEGRLRLLAEILPTSRRLEFAADDQVVMVYRAFAHAELKHLESAGTHDGLTCRHKLPEHQWALRRLLAKLPAPTSH